MREVKVLAHRTGMAKYPPNSSEGLRGCQTDGAYGFECDITFTALSNEPFVWISGMRKILKSSGVTMREMTFLEVAGLERTDCGEKVLHLNDVLDFLEQNQIKAYFDLKYYHLDLFGQICLMPPRLIALVKEKIVAPALRRGLVDKIGFVAFGGGSQLLKAAKLIDSRIATDLIIGLPWLKIDRHLGYLDAITIGWKKPNPWRWRLCAGDLEELLYAARLNGIKVRGGLAETEEEVGWLVEKKFDGIWTNNVPMVQKALMTQDKIWERRTK